VTHIDWRHRVLHVAPAEGGGRSRWSGAGPFLSQELCESMRDVLIGDEVPEWLTDRGRTTLAALKEEFAWLRNGEQRLQAEGGGRFRLWTFAGTKANLTLASALESRLSSAVQFNHLNLTFKGIDMERLQSALASVSGETQGQSSAQLPKRYLPELKFSELLPARLVQDELRARVTCAAPDMPVMDHVHPVGATMGTRE